MRKVKGLWTGGINQFADPAGASFDKEVYVAKNIRLRNNTVAPVLGPLDITAGLPTAGEIQGLYGVGVFAVVFIAGKAYYRNYSLASPVWVLFSGGMQMATTGRIYVETVPTSYINYVRSAVSATNNKAGVNFSGVRNSTPAGLVVMDGVNQPWILFADGTARVTQSFAQWTQALPEYVPIAKYPFYKDGILYCIGADADGKFTQILHAVTGRPLDFMVPVSTTGDKISNVENDSGAKSVAYRVDFDDVTFIGATTTTGGGFLVTTARNSYIVTPDLTNLIFEEPTFTSQFLFSVGAVNSSSVIDVLGDTTVVHYRGIRSFNGVGTTNVEGKNSPFNLKVNALTDGIIQTATAATTYDNYAIYGVQTKYGYGSLWYDTLLNEWVSLDIYPRTNSITMFATVIVGSINKLLYYTADNLLFECFAGPRLTPLVYLPELIPSAAQHAVSRVQAVLSDGTVDGFAECSIYGDRVLQATLSSGIAATVTAGAGVFVSEPYAVALTNNTARPIFDFRDVASFSTRAGIAISWNTDASLIGVVVETDTTGNEEFVTDSSAPANPTPLKIILLGDDGLINSNRTTLNTAIKAERPDYIIGLGDHAYTAGTQSDIDTNLVPYWGTQHDLGTFYACAGNHELDTSSGEAFFAYVRQDGNRRKLLRLGHVDIYIISDGYNTAGAQTDALNLDGPDFEHSSTCNWLRAQIADSTAGLQIVCFHHPPHTSESGHTDAANIAIRAALSAVDWKSIGADVVCSGHAHNYERIHWADGVTYLVAGTGGADLTGFTTPVDGSAARVSGYGYIRATVNALSTLFEFIGADGEVLDGYVARPA